MISLPLFGIYDLLVFVLIFGLVYAVLSRSKFFGSPDIPALIAVAIALISLASSFFVSFVIAFLPYVLAILVFIFIVMLLFATATVPQDTIGSYLRKSTLVPALVIFLMFIFGLIAYGSAAQQSLTTSNGATSGSTNTIQNTTTSNSQASNGDLNYVTGSYIVSILTTPQVLSLLLSLGAMGVAVFFMTRQHGA